MDFNRGGMLFYANFSLLKYLYQIKLNCNKRRNGVTCEVMMHKDAKKENAKKPLSLIFESVGII